LNATVAGGQAISNLVWQMVATEHLYLAGICEARIPAMETKPAEHSVQAILAWYDEHFKADYERVSHLSGEDLLRQVEVFGQTKPVVDYFSIYMSVTIQNRGLLAGYLAALTVKQTSVVSAKTEEAASHSSEHGVREDGELGEQELAGIVGGDSSGTVITGAALNNWVTIKATTTPNTNWQLLQAIQNQNTVGGLGSLFGGGFSGALAGGLSGAVLAEEIGIAGAVNGAAAAAQKSAVAAVQVFDLAL
jgi:outer membrane lipoprotein SlyB